MKACFDSFDQERGAGSGTLVETADIPGGGQLRLIRQGKHFEIMFGGEQLMNSWESRSEEALATLVSERLCSPAPRILIGGLGMGFTLGAALAALPEGAQVVVAELVPEVVTWAAGPLKHIFGDSLADARVSLEVRDVHDVIVDQPGRFDAILLDVDNGPDGLIPANDRLYCAWGLRAAHAALRGNGILAIWSAYQDLSFPARLQDADFDVEVSIVPPEEDVQGPPHTIWLATKLG